MDVNSDGTCDVVASILSYFDQIQSNPEKGSSVISLSSSCVCLVICLLLNIYIAVNIIYRKKYQISYFQIFLVLLTVQIFYLCLSIFSQLLELLPATCFSGWGDAHRVINLVSSPLTKAALGVFGCVAGALTIERFLASTTAGPCLRGFLNFITVMLAMCGPLALVICFILVEFGFIDSIVDLDQEFNFGVEICVYVIFPLLLLTVFGTVNCCKVTMSSRMLPTHQIQAVKINIAVTICTNLALFLFLVQESLNLWQNQLLARNDDVDFQSEVEAMLGHVGMAEHVTRTVLNIMVTLISLLYCCISSDCCYTCCCSSINDLEQIRYEQVEGKELL